LAYLIGVAIGDGNLSNPNGRAVRLRITCDKKYGTIVKNIMSAVQTILPQNKVSIVNRKDNCVDISCYSNKLEELLGWKVGEGSKYEQKVTIPQWIKDDKKLTTLCLKGLIETDGSIYIDRVYKMVNFVTIIPELATDVMEMIENIGFKANIQIYNSQNYRRKYTIRISKNSEEFIEVVKPDKS